MKKFGEDRTCSSKDMIMDRQTERQTDTLIRTFCTPYQRQSKKHKKHVLVKIEAAQNRDLGHKAGGDGGAGRPEHKATEVFAVGVEF